jgi:enoyl-CoA hydratase
MAGYDGFERLLVTRQDRVVTVTLNRPERLNAVDAQMHEELSRIFDALNADPDCDVAVITGAGRAFSAGGDADWMVKLDEPAEWRRKTVESRRIWISLMDLEKPLICKLNGPATGMCATIAALCDVVIGSTQARLGDTHLRLGLAAADGCSAIWPFIVGLQRAKDLLFRAKILSAKEAHELGLITILTEPEALDKAVDDYVAELLAGPIRGIQLTKMAFNFQLKQLVLPAIENALNLLELSNFSDEHRRAVAAFREASQGRKAG